MKREDVVGYVKVIGEENINKDLLVPIIKTGAYKELSYKVTNHIGTFLSLIGESRFGDYGITEEDVYRFEEEYRLMLVREFIQPTRRSPHIKDGDKTDYYKREILEYLYFAKVRSRMEEERFGYRGYRTQESIMERIKTYMNDIINSYEKEVVKRDIKKSQLVLDILQEGIDIYLT